MNRNWMLMLVLLLATSVVLADDAPAGGQAGSEAETQAQSDTDSKAQKEDGAQKEQEGQTAEEAQKDKDAQEKEAAQGAEKPPKDQGPKMINGMSILGNQEAPKSLVIVPWKSSGIGAAIGISTLLDDSRQPVDKEVFLRALSYYEIRSRMKP